MRREERNSDFSGQPPAYFPKDIGRQGQEHAGMLTAYDSTVLLEEIKKAKEICDFLTVYVHWGI